MNKIIKFLSGLNGFYFKSKVFYDLVFFKNKKEFGFCDFDKKLIMVRSDQNNEDFLDTVIHENLHAISHFYLEKQLTEKQVIQLSKGIVNWIKLNTKKQ